MSENLDADGPQRIEWTQQVTGRLSIKPKEEVSGTKHNECLQVGHRSEVRDAGHFKPKMFCKCLLKIPRPSVIGSRDPAPPMGS